MSTTVVETTLATARDERGVGLSLGAKRYSRLRPFHIKRVALGAVAVDVVRRLTALFATRWLEVRPRVLRFLTPFDGRLLRNALH